MTDIVLMQFDLSELCLRVQVPTDVIVEIIEQGIIEPEGHSPDTWLFNDQMMSQTQKAIRLHRDFDIEWPGIALAMDLIDELDQLRHENKRLKRRLQRFSIE